MTETRRLSAFLVGLAFLLAACGKPSPQDLARTTNYQLARERGAYLTVNNLHVFTIVMGSGRDLILIHGDPSSTWTWHKVIEPLAAHYRVHAIDLPGYGFSDKPADLSYDTAWFANFVVSYMDVQHVQRAAIAGNSMGGYVASEMAIRYPDRLSALILIDAAGLPAENKDSDPLPMRLLKVPLLGALLRELPARPLVRSGLRDAVYDPAFVNDEEVDEFYLPLRTQNGLTAMLARMGQKIPEDRDQQIKAIEVPTLVISGDSDRLVPVNIARQYHALIPGSELVIIEKSGHIPQEEHPDRVIAEITRFLDAHP